MSEGNVQDPLKSETAMGFLAYIQKNPNQAYIKAITDKFDYSTSTVVDVFETLSELGAVKIDKGGRWKVYHPDVDSIVKEMINVWYFLYGQERRDPDLEKIRGAHPPLPGAEALVENRRTKNLLWGLFLKEVIENTRFKDRIECESNFLEISERVVSKVEKYFELLFIGYYGEKGENAPDDFREIYEFFTFGSYGKDYAYFEAVKDMFGESEESVRLRRSDEETEEEIERLKDRLYEEMHKDKEERDEEKIDEITDEISDKNRERVEEIENYYKENKIRIPVNHPDKGRGTIVLNLAKENENGKTSSERSS